VASGVGWGDNNTIGAVADAPAQAPVLAVASISIGEPKTEESFLHVVSFNNLDDMDTKLEMKEAELFTELKHSVYSRICRSRTNK
jgi:ethanolamine ammonia-lyase small subunit